MKRCFLLVLIFISMAPLAWAQSGAEEIVWTRDVGPIVDIMFSHNGKYIGFLCDEKAGIIRVSDSTVLWKDSLPRLDIYHGMEFMAFSQDDSLFAYMRFLDSNIYIKYTSTGAVYKTIKTNPNIGEMRFIDSSKLLVQFYGIIGTINYTSPTPKLLLTPEGHISYMSKTGKYGLDMYKSQKFVHPNLYRVYPDSIAKKPLQFTGQVLPGDVENWSCAFSKDDKLMVLIPFANDYPDGMAMYILNIETLVCSKVMVTGIISSSYLKFFIDTDKKHIVVSGKRNGDTTVFEDNIILSLENGSIKNYYRIIDYTIPKYLLGDLFDSSPDSLYYIGSYGGNGLALLHAIRTTSDVPMPKSFGDVRIFPNPSISGSQTISIEGISEAKSIIISDIFGRESFRSEFIQSNGNSGISFPLPSLQKGVYFISIIDGEGSLVTKKLMVGE